MAGEVVGLARVLTEQGTIRAAGPNPCNSALMAPALSKCLQDSATRIGDFAWYHLQSNTTTTLNSLATVAGDKSSPNVDSFCAVSVKPPET